MTRRRFGLAATAAFTLSGGPGARELKAVELSRTRAALALRAAFQSVVWVGVEAGIFRQHAVDVTFTLETGGPRAATGTVRGDGNSAIPETFPSSRGWLRGKIWR
jgi:hypothetical protein